MTRVDLDDLLEVIPGHLIHNLERPVIRQALVAEVEAFLAIEGTRPTIDLLTPATVTEWRADFIAIGAPLLGALAQTSEFAAWEGGDLSAAEPPQTEVDETDAADESDGDAAE